MMGDDLKKASKVLKVCIEPVELELESDGGLLIASLQSALPGASGLYFISEHKKVIKFDGKKFYPPNDGWQDRHYYVTLGARSFDYPFGSYANASKQFEKSVNAVERMLNGNFFVPSKEKEKNLKKRIIEDQKLGDMEMLLKMMTTDDKTEREDQANKKPSKSVEECTLELTKALNAKDAIIEEQKDKIRNLESKLMDNKRASNEVLKDLTKAKDRCAFLEQEISSLKNNKEEQFLRDQVDELNQSDKDDKELIKNQAKEIDELLKKIDSLKEENATIRCRVNELEQSLVVMTDSKEGLEYELKRYRSLVQLQQIEDESEALSYPDLCKEMNCYKNKNQKLMSDLSVAEEKNKHLNDICAKIFEENTDLKKRCEKLEGMLITGTSTFRKANIDEKTNQKGIEQENEALKKELEEFSEKISSQSKMIESLTMEASVNIQKANKAEALCSELERRNAQLEMSKQNELIKELRKTENLQLELEQAQSKIEELSLLFNSIKGME